MIGIIALTCVVISLTLATYLYTRQKDTSTKPTEENHSQEEKTEDKKKETTDEPKKAKSGEHSTHGAHDDHHHEKGWWKAFWEVGVFKWGTIAIVFWLVIPYGCEHLHEVRQKMNGTYKEPLPNYMEYRVELKLDNVVGIFFLQPTEFGPDKYIFRPSAGGSMEIFSFDYKTGDGIWQTSFGESGTLKVTNFTKGLSKFTFSGEWSRDLPTPLPPQGFTLTGFKQ